MTQEQKNLVKMFKALQAVLSEHQQAWNILPAFVENHAQFEQELLALDELIYMQGLKVVGVTATKDKLYEFAVDKADLVANSIRVYADTIANSMLSEQLDFSKTDFGRGGSRKAIQLIDRILAAASEHEQPLIPFGVTSEKLNELTYLRNELDTGLGKPRDAIVARKTFTEECAGKISEIRALLRNRLDKLTEVLRPGHPEFAKSYSNARIVVDYKGKSNKKGIDPPQGEISSPPVGTE